jgi:hypothetical protein
VHRRIFLAKGKSEGPSEDSDMSSTFIKIEEFFDKPKNS